MAASRKAHSLSLLLTYKSVSFSSQSALWGNYICVATRCQSGAYQGGYPATTTVTATKTSFKNWTRSASNFVKCWQIWVEFEAVSKFRKRQRKSLSYVHAKLGYLHVVVVHLRQRNVKKSVMHVQSCCTANLNLLVFCGCRWRRSSRCLSSLVTVKCMSSE